MRKNKKKLLVIALLLFTITGIVGYKVYSYYWTQGEFGNNDQDSNAWITIDGSFDPTVNGSFINQDSGSFSLECEDIDTTTGQVTCSGELYVYNNGDTPIDLGVSSNNEYTYVSLSNFSGSVDSFDYTWDDDRISPGETATLTVSATINVDMGVNDDTAQEVDSPVEVSGSVEAYVRIIATQVHSY